jgi:hypothetical protein
MAGPGRKVKLLTIPADLLARYRAGELSIFLLARLLDVSSTRAYRELRRLGIDTSRRTRLRLLAARRRGYASAGERVGRVVELYGQGLSIGRVSRQTGLSAEGVHKILRQHGLRLRA